MESIGFKEWAIICEALGRGQQSIILRKGGMAEGSAGFSFRHREFFLFPTFFHEQVEKTRIGNISIPSPNEAKVELQFFAKLERTHLITSWEIAEALEPLHIWHRAVVRERFEYDQRGQLHVALVRVFRLEPKWILLNDKSYGGCRSWLRLPECPPATRFQAVLADEEHRHRRSLLDQITDASRVTTL